MVLVQKWQFFQLFFLGNIVQENVFYDILKLKNAFLNYKNKKFKKSKNLHFSKGDNPWCWTKNGHYSNFFFLSNIGQEKFFYDILQRKNDFLGYRNRKFKESKNWHFSKGVNPWFWSTNGHFPNFFLGNIGQENMFYNMLGRNKAFQGYKNKKFKESKNWHFYKGVNPWFWSKNVYFPKLFFFRQYRPGKRLLRYFTTKKLLSRL